MDDDASFLSAATRALAGGAEPLEVHTAQTGGGAIGLLEALASDAAGLPDFVVLDYHLPDATAPALLRWLADQPLLANLPVLVLTQDARERARETALRAGARGFAAKPSRVRSLREILLRFWSDHGPRRDDPTR